MGRLAFVRLLFQQGIDQSQLPEPLNATSVLSLHDASELLLGAIADQLGASLPRHLAFMDHWKALGPDKLAAGVELPARQRMDRVNELRNALKHKGTLPSKAAVELACADVRTFLEDSTKLIFGLDFADISLADLIAQKRTRDMVNSAYSAAATGDIKEAMGLLAEAYDELFNSHGSRDRFPAFGETIPFPMSVSDIARVLAQPPQPKRPMPPNPHPLAQQIVSVTKAVQEMQRGLQVMALGLDFRQFSRFRQLTPHVAWFADHHKERFVQPGYDPTREEFDYCCQFLVTVALRLAELDVHAARPAWWPVGEALQALLACAQTRLTAPTIRIGLPVDLQWSSITDSANGPATSTTAGLSLGESR
jgi:hypothetical protein